MATRYTRDQIILIALDMVHLPNLEVHDAPSGVVQPDAFCIQWLQDIIDFWYHMVPFSATVTDIELNCTAQSDSVALPIDFILDVRNGYTVETIPGDTRSMQRIERLPFPKFLNRKLYSYQKTNNALFPRHYCIQDVNAMKQQLMKVTPTPTIATVGRLWYYKLPAALTANERTLFPNDRICIEYLRVRALEWANIYDPGTAEKYCEKLLAGMRASGLMNEPEDDEINFSSTSHRHGYGYPLSSVYGWMGSV